MKMSQLRYEAAKLFYQSEKHRGTLEMLLKQKFPGLASEVIEELIEHCFGQYRKARGE